MVLYDNFIFIPGIDPHFGDEFNAGNFYRLILPNDFKKYRYNSKGKPYFPNVPHLTGIFVDPDTGHIYLTSIQGEIIDKPNCIFKSIDYGETWQIIPIPFIPGFDRIVKYNGNLYAVSLSDYFRQRKTGIVHYSNDEGETWNQLKHNNNPIKDITDFCIFKGRLVLLTDINGKGYIINKQGKIESFSIPIIISGMRWPSPHWFVNVEDQFIVFMAQKKFYITRDLIHWEIFGEDALIKTNKNYFNNIAYWPKRKSLLLGACGGWWGGIWIYNIEDLFISN